MSGEQSSKSMDWDKVFGHSYPQTINYSNPKIVDKHGIEIKISTPVKNSLYRKAKQLKGELQDALCTKSECDIPNERNVNKMLNSEFKVSHKIDEFKKCMKAIGAENKDYDIQRLRRR